MGKGGTNTVTQASPPPQFLNAYQNAFNRAQQVANTPYQPYAGGNPAAYVAPLSQQQQAAIQNVANAQGMAQPYYNQAQQYIANSQTPIWQNVMQFSPGNVMQYYNPYVQEVVNTTQQQFANLNQQQANALTANAASAGALGGNRWGVAQGVLAGQQALAEAPQLAGLEQAGYNTALGEFNVQQQQQLGAQEAQNWLASQAGFAETNLGTTAESMALQGAAAQLETGGLQQQMAQEYLNIPYENYLAAQAYPFQTTGWLASIAEGLGGLSGGISSTTPMEPSLMSQIGGTALAGAAAFGAMGGFSGLSSLLGGGTAAATDMADSILGAFAFMNRGGRTKRPRGFAEGGGTDSGPSTDADWENIRNLGQPAPPAPHVEGIPVAKASYEGSPTAMDNAVNQFPSLPPRGASTAGMGPGGDASAAGASPPAGFSNPPPSGNMPDSDAVWSQIYQSAKPNPWLSLFKAGAAMAAGQSPFPLANLGAGMLAGANDWERQSLSANDLLGRVQEARDRLRETSELRQQQMENQAAYREAMSDYHNRLADLRQQGLQQQYELGQERLQNQIALMQDRLNIYQALADSMMKYRDWAMKHGDEEESRKQTQGDERIGIAQEKEKASEDYLRDKNQRANTSALLNMSLMQNMLKDPKMVAQVLQNPDRFTPEIVDMARRIQYGSDSGPGPAAGASAAAPAAANPSAASASAPSTPPAPPWGLRPGAVYRWGTTRWQYLGGDPRQKESYRLVQ